MLKIVLWVLWVVLAVSLTALVIRAAGQRGKSWCPPVPPSPPPSSRRSFENILQLFLWVLEDEYLPRRAALIPLPKIVGGGIDEFLEQVNAFGATHGFVAEHRTMGAAQYLRLRYDEGGDQPPLKAA